MDLKEIKGLGSKRIETLNEKGIESAEDLALCFPKTYFDLDSKDYFIEDGKYKLIKAIVCSEVKVVRIKNNFNYSYVECLDINNKKFKAVWYNQPYIKNAINNNDVLYLYGKNSDSKHGYFVVSSFRNENKIDANTKLLPIYKTYKNIGQSVISDAVKQAVNITNIKSFLPEEFEKKELNIQLNDAIKIIHNPENKDSLLNAKKRIDTENVLPYIKIADDIKNTKIKDKTQKYINFDDIFTKFCSFLPYNLTQSQLNVLSSINKDLEKRTPMNRLVQGDVGTGKTIIALISCAISLASGYSSILIAPTEILAVQHYSEAKKYFNKLGLNVNLLTASTSRLERNAIINDFNSKNPTLLIGTHSCLSGEIDIENVGLLVIDEQHRFGVKQRSNIIDRNPNIDFLMLSATPIPRSLSIVYYGGLDVSILEKPPKEKLIQTNLVNQAKEDDMWNYINQKILQGSKVYVVCANIDDSDDDHYQGLSVNSMYKYLCSKFNKDIVLMAHGKLSSDEENNVLNKFKSDKYKILVSTTIVEVGVDVKEADIIVLVSPEKFGLATLHQLRGRVGRAGQQSYCFCMTRNINENSIDRIKFFKENLNGFDIAEFDYKSRGSGNLLGTNQHGNVENIFDYVSLETYNNAKNIYEKLKLAHDTDAVFSKSGIYKTLNFKSLN